MSAAISILPAAFEPEFAELPESTQVRCARPVALDDVTASDLRPYMEIVQRMAAVLLRRTPPTVLRDDLVAAGTIGLIETFKKHGDLREKQEFEWYARVRIRGAMLDELRRQDWISRRARAKERAAKAEGKTGGHAMVAFDDLAESAQATLASHQESPLDIAERNSESSALARAVAKLPDRERSIVTQHYFQGVPFNEIAAQFGVTEARISQLHSRALASLRGLVDAE